jgi:hypothetical protein
MNHDPIASLSEAVERLETSRRDAIDGLEAAAAALTEVAPGRSAAATRDLKAASKRVADAAGKVGSLQFHGSYKGTNASFLPAPDRRMLASIALAAAVLLGGWVFLIATLAAAQLEPGQRLALGGTWILIGVVAGFLAAAILLAYGFRPVNVALRSVDGQTAEVEQSAEVRARRRLERQLAQATRDANRATKRAEKAENEAQTARAEARTSAQRARDAVAERDRMAAADDAGGNGEVDRATARRAATG